jgi:glycosyltransferase involved in cell wall biosynthesis
MKVVCYFREPAAYTLSLRDNVHRKLGVDCRFLRKETKHAGESEAGEYLSSLSFWKRWKFIKNDLQKFDAIIWNGYNSIEFIFLWLLNFRYKRLVLLESDTQLNIPSLRWKRWLKKLVLSYLFQHEGVYALAGGEHVHKEHFRYYGMPEEHIFFLPMVSEVSKYAKAPRRYSKPFVFLFVGRFIGLKNIPYLLEEYCAMNLKDCKLVLVGEGPEQISLERQYKHRTDIEFKGALYADDLVQAYHDAHALVLPSLKEQWGLVVNEAMAAGLPVIASDRVGAVHDLIYGKETGLVFDPLKKGDLKEKLLSIQDKEKYESYSRNAYELLNNQWNFETYKQLLESALKSIND